MYSVHQHWDPLEVCAVGQSYPPEFYNFIKSAKVRNVMERIAIETEEDYQSLIFILDKFNVKIIRSKIDSDLERYFVNGKAAPPPMTPRDYTAMVGDTFFTPVADTRLMKKIWHTLRGVDWPNNCPTTLQAYHNLSESIKKELRAYNYDWQKMIKDITDPHTSLTDIIQQVENEGNEIVYNTGINSAMTTRIGRDLFHGTWEPNKLYFDEQIYSTYLKNYRNHTVNSEGHSDATFCPVVPGLIVSLYDLQNYAETFPGWEVIYLPNQSWGKVKPFLELKEKNRGKWWIPGEENNNELIEFIDLWLNEWVGYVEETVFDVNMLVIDEKNVVCSNVNDKVFEAFDRYGITPHVCNFRHRYFWDGGIHCITSDLSRRGRQQTYF